MADESKPDTKNVTPYDLAPDPVPPPQPKSKTGMIGDKSFIDDLPEDADLEHDPEVERALKGEPLDGETAEEKEPENPFIKPGGDAKTLACVGAGVLLCGVIIAGLGTPAKGFGGFMAAAIFAFYMTVLHSITGVASLTLTAHLVKQPLGKLELGAARMFVVVAAGQFMFNLHLPNYGQIVGPLLAAATYLILVGTLFRLGFQKFKYVVAVHFALIIAIWLAMVLFAWTLPEAAPK